MSPVSLLVQPTMVDGSLTLTHTKAQCQIPSDGLIKNLDQGFVDGSSYASADIICAKDAKNAALSAKIAAGQTIEFQWTKWPESHHGPVLTYLASCKGDCKTVDKTTLEFFKIDEAGLLDDTTLPGTWASDKLISNNNTWTSTIPSDIAPGNYVVRHEIIALHSAGSANGAQNYVQCINLDISSSGTAAPAGTLGEKLYTPTDKGILVTIYEKLLTYVIPGPALYKAGGASTGSASTAPAASVAPTSTAAPVSTSAPATAATSAPAVYTSSPPTTLVTSVASASATAAPPSGNDDDDDDDTCEA
ncbi:hypothetical protein DID88_009010 [Monilinia fructigena]|uniref:Auxiliary Activity family 9 catalytic domain-containing protein n=1 Tax=Monilinia fructigena TaxID=38457 RepID=A0A395IFI5_9HELO|nr:hypothetical protein DID88_009010 [Monilinia fructigena]